MTLLHLKWSASRPNRGAGSFEETDTARRRSLSGTGGPARRQEKLGDTAATRWRSATNINVSGSAFPPKPTPPRGRFRAKQNAKFRQINGSKDDGQAVALVATPTTKTQPRKPLPVPALSLAADRQKKFPYVLPKQDSLSTTEKTDTASMPNTVRENGSGHSVGLRLLLTGRSPVGAQEAFKRSGSAPSPLAMTLSTSADVETPLPDERDKLGCPPAEPERNLAKTSRSCWDEKTDTTTAPEGAATPPPTGSTPTGGNTDRSAVFEDARTEEPSPQRSGPNNSSVRSGGRKCPSSGPLVPLPSPEQQSYGKSDKNRRRRLEPLRRRKSDTGGSGSCRKASNTRSSDGSKAVSAGSGSTFAKRRSSTPGLTSPDIPRPSTTDSINTSSEGASSKKISGSSDATKGLVADQGHLKARIRVMEWKRRRAEEMKTQQEEQATAEQVRQAEADTEAARKLAATRAEEAERRLAVDREKTASAIRATEAAEKWAKATHQREQRRAKVYAINAVMRTAFEREFKAFSLEQERCATRAAGLDPEDPPSTKKETPPSTTSNTSIDV